jgi:PAS domain S-box-containing protein
LRHRDGHWVWILDRARVVERDAAAHALRMVGTHMDVSAGMQSREALRRSEESLAITLMSIGDAVIATDAQGRITRMNAMAERLTGWVLADALGRPLHEVFRTQGGRLLGADADPVARVLAQGQTVGLASGTVLLARDGQVHRIADSAAPIRATSGEIVGVVLVFTDVTEQYQTLQALRDREAQLSSMADALPGPVARLDREGRYLFVNAAYERWFGLRPQDMLGRRRDEVLADTCRGTAWRRTSSVRWPASRSRWTASRPRWTARGRRWWLWCRTAMPKAPCRAASWSSPTSRCASKPKMPCA